VDRQKSAINRMIFYLPYDFANLETGSRVRPYKMYNAFLQLGYDVKLISGNTSERLAHYRRLRNSENYAFCYVEASSYPLHTFVDHYILAVLKRRNIPVAVYYRDAYWKFRSYFSFAGLKRLELLLRYRADLALFNRVATVMFFPTASLADLVNVKIPKALLPPGGEYKPVERQFGHPLRAVYMGGVTYRYGLTLMLNALEIINKREIRVFLELVCREKELKDWPSYIQQKLMVPWINVQHVSGDALESIYARCHVGLVPLVKDEYNDLSLPIKLFEYLSFGLPVIVTHCNEMSKFVKENKCGIVCEDNPDSLASALCRFIDDQHLLERLSERALQTIMNNLWMHRTKTVITYLGSPVLYGR
jgi:glycosyltransferase involved in cell wall biosynthesis